jgi:hypothetical protein
MPVFEDDEAGRRMLDHERPRAHVHHRRPASACERGAFDAVHGASAKGMDLQVRDALVRLAPAVGHRLDARDRQRLLTGREDGDEEATDAERKCGESAGTQADARRLQDQ